MRCKLTKRIVETTPPGERDIIIWDTLLPGFFAKITPKGRRAFGCYFRAGGKERRPVFGTMPPFTVEKAREHAEEMLRAAARGQDPVAAQKEAAAQTTTVEQLFRRYLAEHVDVRQKPYSRQIVRWNGEKHVIPALGKRRVVDVTRADILALMHKMRATPGAANRIRAMLSKMFALAEEWEIRPPNSNPARGVRRYKEAGRERYLTPRELQRLAKALDAAEHEAIIPAPTIKAIRLLLWTGARKGEILSLRWNAVDLESGVLWLSDSKTGRKQIVLNQQAVDILRTIPRGESPFVFPAKSRTGHLVEIRTVWERLMTAAEILDFHPHDMRHTFASIGVGLGYGLPVIGKLLGHEHAMTTSRYAHLAHDPLRIATAQIADAMHALMNKEGEGK